MRLHITIIGLTLLVSVFFVAACGEDSGSDGYPDTTYTITYDGNGSTGGSVPVDATEYKQGDTVTIPGNAGNLVKTGYSYTGWNTQADGSGTTYTQGQTFAMGSANVTVYAQWSLKLWTWVSGDNTIDQKGVYGTKGTADAANKPGSRESSISWIDSSGNLWLFGGYGYDSAGASGYLNDLWKFDGTNWTWVSGDSTSDNKGVYGTKGTAVGTNKPGSRAYSISWIDSSGNLWLFGGYGIDSALNLGHLNDLWKFDGSNWIWVSGDNIRFQSGDYGTQGTAAATNKPGGRLGRISWIDSSGNLWLFGGAGYDRLGNSGRLNDLWKFDGTNWTWVSGDTTINQTGVYGTQGTAATANKPGSRAAGVGWIDSRGNLWLFGGEGYDKTLNMGHLNDLWKFDGANWTWVSGDDTCNQSGVYGTQGTAAAANKPGGRRYSNSWIDSGGNLWLFGGEGYDKTQNLGQLNDLWQFDGANWTWVSGDNTTNQSGVYGTQGTAAATNKPGARSASISWIDSSGNFWLFGGYGYDSAGLGYLNDLWKYGP